MINLIIGGSRISFWRLKNSSWRYQNGSLQPPKWRPEALRRCKELPSSLHLRSKAHLATCWRPRSVCRRLQGGPWASQEAQQVAKHLPKRSLESPKRSPRGQNIASKTHLISIILFYTFFSYFLVNFREIFDIKNIAKLRPQTFEQYVCRAIRTAKIVLPCTREHDFSSYFWSKT